MVVVPRTLARQRSIQGRASYVTTTTATSSAMLRVRPRSRPRPEPLVQHHRPTRRRHQQGHEEEEEARCERLVRPHAEAAEEADEERLADGDPVQREGYEHDEEEERPHHVVDADAELDPHGLRTRPDREHAHGLDGERHGQDPGHEPWPVAVVVHAFVEEPERTLQADAHEQRSHPPEERPRRPREEDVGEEERPEDEEPLDPEVRADVVVADREDEADRAEDNGRGPPEPALQDDRASHDGRASGMATRRLDDANGVAADRRRQDLPRGVRDEVRAGEPAEPLQDAVRREQAPPPGREDRDRQHHDRDREDEPAEARLPQHVHRRPEVDLPDEVADRGRGQNDRAEEADAAGHRSASTSSVSSSNATFAAATAVGWPGPSYGGLTSTT